MIVETPSGGDVADAVTSANPDRWESLRDALARADQSLTSLLSLDTLTKIPMAILILAAFRLLYVLTYPPNLGADAINYFEMIWRNQSNLIHAGGYPFFMRLVIWILPLIVAWRCWHWARGKCQTFNGRFLAAAIIIATIAVLRWRWGRWAARNEVPEALVLCFQYYIIILQHLLVVLTLWFAYATLADFLGKIAAYATVFAFALHPSHIAHASVFFPEWLQSSFLAVSFCLTYWAFKAEDEQRKLLLYALAGAAFTWCFTVKPSILVVGWIFPLIFVCDRMSWRCRIRTVLGVAAAFIITYGGFLQFFHKPSTGTYVATHDKAWVLLGKVQMFFAGDRYDLQAGIHTKRLIYLNSVLPNGPENLILAGPVWHVDRHVPIEIRAPYREKYLYVLSADHATLDRLLEGYQPHPRGEFWCPFSPTMAYLDMAAGDRLGTMVFFEHVLAHPGAYAYSVWDWTWKSVWEGAEVHTIVEGPADLAAITPEPTALAPLGFTRVKQEKTPFKQTLVQPPAYYWYLQPYVWKPGVVFFAAWRWIGGFVYLHKPVLFVMVAGVLIAGLRSIGNRRLNARAVFILIMAATIVTFIVCSNMLFFYRWKEHLPMLLPISAMFLASLLEMLWLARAVANRIFPPRANGSDVRQMPRTEGPAPNQHPTSERTPHAA